MPPCSARRLIESEMEEDIMAKNHSGIGKAAVIAAGAGAAAYAVKKHKELSQEGKTLTGQLKEKAIQTAEKSIKMPVPDPAYRNTER